MRLFRHTTDLPADARGAVVALGNFDGVHRGHQQVIATAQRIASELGTHAAILTFEPHPRSVFKPDAAPFRLSPFRVKARRIEALGVDELFVRQFDDQFRQKTADDFISEVLVRDLAVRHVVCGYDFLFGHKRAGTPELLRSAGTRLGFGMTEVGPVADPNGGLYSSTRVREALEAGRVREATHIMGSPWEIEGRVEQGDQKGRTIGYPTANVGLDGYLRPAFGVYAIRAGIDQGDATVWIDGVANIGNRPTVGGLVERLEAHLFDFSGDLYGRHLRVQLIDYLRPEQKFASFDALKEQIRLDAEKARAVLAQG